MALISLKNRLSAPRVNDTVKSAEYNEITGDVIVRYELKNGNIIRAEYAVEKASEAERLYRDVEAILGECPENFETESIIGKPCQVEIKESPWKKDQPWRSVGRILPPLVEPDNNQQVVTHHSDNDSIDLLDD